MTIFSINLVWLCSNLFNGNEMKILQHQVMCHSYQQILPEKSEVQSLADPCSLKALASRGHVYK